MTTPDLRQEETAEAFSAALDQDLRAAARSLGREEARYLVDSYYRWQEQRKRGDNQLRALASEPHTMLWLLASQARLLERRIKAALGAYAAEQTVGRWSMSIVGIGPVIAAGLLAHIDIERAPTVGHIWRFAGLDPTVTWEKGQKRPWNARLRALCWNIGESFVKTQSRPGDFYGHIYAARKAKEQERNERGAYREQAELLLSKRRLSEGTLAYQSYRAGKLPPSHLHTRAKRYTVKLFLSHWHHVAYETRFGTPPPAPYILAHPEILLDEEGEQAVGLREHVHFIAPPNWPMEEP